MNFSKIRVLSDSAEIPADVLDVVHKFKSTQGKEWKSFVQVIGDFLSKSGIDYVGNVNLTLDFITKDKYDRPMQTKKIYTVYPKGTEVRLGISTGFPGQLKKKTLSNHTAVLDTIKMIRTGKSMISTDTLSLSDWAEFASNVDKYVLSLKKELSYINK